MKRICFIYIYCNPKIGYLRDGELGIKIFLIKNPQIKTLCTNYANEKIIYVYANDKQ